MRGRSDGGSRPSIYIATLTGRHAASARARAGKPELQASRRLLDGLYPAGRRQGPLAGAADACE
eukprot:scaffold86902_cov69-Phaeocystis_antarctica.AAC.1